MREEWDGTHKFWADKYLAELNETRAEVASLKAQLAEARVFFGALIGQWEAVTDCLCGNCNAARWLASHPSSPEAPKESKP